MKFWKMEGLGNDFICLNCLHDTPQDPRQLAIKVCNRNFGIGADGLLLMTPSKHGLFKMEVYNSDGSNPEMCGNGLRCVAKLAYILNLTTKTQFKIESDAGIQEIWLISNNKNQGIIDGNVKEIDAVRVGMNKPQFHPHQLAADFSGHRVLNQLIDFNGNNLYTSLVSMGNPHTVIKVDDLNAIPINKLGPLIEHDSRFRRGTNVEFIKINSGNKIDQRTWERGVGETLCCGSGACAAAVSAIDGYNLSSPVQVQLLGGELTIEYDQNEIFMTGNANIVYQGLYNGFK